ncbi:membrane fusion protein, multidrug efflux system [Catalinimonas alkaloidigena]|uniref:Membrane fusion protein, multidrug efflux system n=1 Tax=Catalinimonas alkaloidigena TaxID=1075417 RepID=A0A1G9E4N3_9BACT|nr:efflux RND transporter periplasmic adaptor subunit [Catalinimonas alkaloidigena]SDK71042.1 membrane fusion protein, multidrug efflux system [Catalinimonas alkaloidigena]
MNKTSKRILYGVIAVVIIFLLALPKLNLFSDPEETATPATAPGSGAVAVEGMVAKLTTLNNRIVATGTVLANEEIEVRSEISGKVTEILFQEGDRVQKGQTLLRINDDELRAQLQRLDYLRQLAEDNESRYKKLLDREAISQEEYDIAATEMKTSQAEVENLKAQVSKAIIRAPFEGVIGLRQISLGSYIAPTTPITTLVDNDPIKVEFSIPARYSKSVKVGNAIDYQVEGSPNTFRGVIYAIDPSIDPVTRTLRVRARTPNPEGELLPGAFATIELVLEEIGETIMLPTEAVVPNRSGHIVYVSRAGKAQPQDVEVGLRTPSDIQITQGISAGDTIVVTGVLQVRAGAPLQFMNVTSSDQERPTSVVDSLEIRQGA